MLRTTVVGTYPRIGDTSGEQGLRRAIARFDKGEASEADVRAAERDVVRAILTEQAAAGIDVVTDGQIPWYDSQSHVARGLAGIEIGGLVRYFDTNTYYRQPIVTGAVEWTHPILVDEWRFAQDASRAPVKAVLTGPVTLASLALDRHYAKKRGLALALADALAEEVAALQSAGAAHIQIDEPILTKKPEDLPLVRDTLGTLAANKGSAELTLATYFGDVAKIYRDLLEVPADVVGLDLVQGSKTWSHIQRHGSEKPLSLGVVDARNTRLEEPGSLATRIRALRDSVDLGRSYLAPSNGLEFLPRERARQKLAVLVETARRAGGDG
jgi:5-methyltetrahydropteroyltriglutamate--homocysteine methyltransferase